MINKQLQQFNQQQLDSKYNLLKTYDGEKLSIREREIVVERVGNGSLSAMDVIKKVLPIEQIMKKTDKKKMAKEVLAESISFEKIPEILITGQKGYKTQIATCCMPRPTEEIIGYITRGRGVTIHKKRCKVLKGLDDARREPLHHASENYQVERLGNATDQRAHGEDGEQDAKGNSLAKSMDKPRVQKLACRHGGDKCGR